MELVFVHGINQQGKSEDSLRAEWSEHLREALKAAGQPKQFDAIAPFYGELLYDRSRGVETNRVTPQGSGEDNAVDEEEAQFLAEGLEEIALHDDRIPEGAIAAEIENSTTELEEQGWLPMHRKINAIVRFFEGISPFQGDIALRVLKQAYTYLRVPGVDDEVEALVSPHFKGGPRIIVSHSLGTIVSFRILRRMALAGQPAQVALFVTLGSPLSLRTVRKALGPKYVIPEGVGRWINAYDPDDFVTLGQGLNRSTFADGIENIDNVQNVKGDAHAIEGYLKNPDIASTIGKII